MMRWLVDEALVGWCRSKNTVAGNGTLIRQVMTPMVVNILRLRVVNRVLQQYMFIK